MLAALVVAVCYSCSSGSEHNTVVELMRPYTKWNLYVALLDLKEVLDRVGKKEAGIEWEEIFLKRVTFLCKDVHVTLHLKRELSESFVVIGDRTSRKV